MHKFSASFSALAFAGVILNPAAFAEYRPPVSAPDAARTALVAAAAVPSGIAGIDKIKDSVLRIGVELTGTFNVPPWRFDDYGNIVPSDDPYDALSSTITTYRLGSGFVVDPAGYLITNAHVVDTSYTSVAGDLWDEYAREIPIGIAESRPDLTQDEVTALANVFLDYVSRNGTWNDTTYNVVVFNPAKTDAVGDIAELMSGGWSAEIKKIGQPYPQIGKDVAIVKVNAGQAFVPVTLGNSSGVVAGSGVYIIGYPTIADLSDKSFLVPTVTSGIVSAIKPSDLGDYKVIQVDAAVTGGNSGGPVLDSSGRVIGIATFGATQSDGYNWALPVELAKEYLNELNVTPRTAWNLGIFGFLGGMPTLNWAVVAAVLFLVICGLVWIMLRKKMHIAITVHSAPAAPTPPPPPPPPANFVQ